MQPPCGVAEGTSDARVSDLKEALVQNGKALKAACRQNAKKRKRLHCAGLGVAARKTVVAVYMLSNFNMDLTLRMACALTTISYGSNGYPTAALIQEMLLTTPLPDLTALDDTASRKAQAFLAEAATEQWVYDCNTNHGQAPSAMDTFLKWEEAFHGQKLDMGVPNKRMVNKWVQRWRARWGVRRKVLKQVVSRDPAVLRDKARASQLTTFCLLFLGWVAPFLGPECGPKNGSPSCFMPV